MEHEPEWRAKLALACYFALAIGLLIGSVIVAFVLVGMRIDYLDLPFPLAFISTPVNEIVILAVTLLFASHKRASLKELGLKTVSLRILLIFSVATVFLYLTGLGISVSEEIVFGPDPMGELFAESVMPRDFFQLIAMIILSLVLVAPCEELAFRGFIQKGFENSFGKTKGLLIASVLWGLFHGLNTLYAIIPAFAAGLILGYVWQRTGGNTIASALMHGINNSISFALAYFLTV
ncbi:MAG: CPBP family intramembrane metalloprotease [Candidatus Bathyarchaeota archaeon]|nr:CPBP family intramembrane metalloprotease [Candidatus Bathyarchaeota archaeon]